MTLSEGDLFRLFGVYEVSPTESLVEQLTTEQIVAAVHPSTLITRTFPTFHWLDEADTITTCYGRRSPDRELVDDVYFAASELLKNAAFHGNKLDPKKRIDVISGWVAERFYCSIRDQGAGFDIAQPKYTAPGSPGRGLGLIAVRARVDALYNFLDPTVYFAKGL